MAITPQTNLKLLKCNLNLDNNNQINFSTATAQYNYFNSLPKLSVDNFTYQRKDNVIRYPAHNLTSLLENKEGIFRVPSLIILLFNY